MPYFLNFKEKDVLGKGKFKDNKGNTECAAFVRQATGAPIVTSWIRGKKVSEAKQGEIKRGTAIATFDENKKYPSDKLGKHAAIYLSHDKTHVDVLDQWDSQGEVLRRPIWFNRPKDTRRSNNADTFYVIE